MKTIFISMVMLASLFHVEAQTEQSIQQKIMDAFMTSFVEQNNSKMVSLIDEISAMHDKSKNNLFLYWKGYAQSSEFFVGMDSRTSMPFFKSSCALFLSPYFR